MWLQIPALSPSEKAVCDGLSRGESFKEIAHSMEITSNTARTLGRRAMGKFGVRTVHELDLAYRYAVALAGVVSSTG